MLKVGITGGIGSGKSIVSKIFELLGIPVYNADDAAKYLMNNDPDIKAQLIKHFGADTYINDRLDRAWLAAKVFNNEAQLKILNSIVHPVTIQNAIEWMNKQHTPIVMKEAAIFFESGSSTEMDYMVGVFAPVGLRIERAIKRDNASRKTILNRISKQMDEDEKMRRCNFVLVNDDMQLLLPQVLQLHQELLQMNAH